MSRIPPNPRVVSGAQWAPFHDASRCAPRWGNKTNKPITTLPMSLGRDTPQPLQTHRRIIKPQEGWWLDEPGHTWRLGMSNLSWGHAGPAPIRCTFISIYTKAAYRSLRVRIPRGHIPYGKITTSLPSSIVSVSCSIWHREDLRGEEGDPTLGQVTMNTKET